MSIALSATGLAPGLVYVAPNITGGVTAVGTFPIVLGAANTFGSDAQTLTITANAPILSPDEISDRKIPTEIGFTRRSSKSHSAQIPTIHCRHPTITIPPSPRR